MEHGASRSGGEELLANLGWVRRLALAIVRDSSAADDVTQEVARVALERGEPIPASGLRAWLGAVTRRLALDRTRAEAARHARERSVARPEGDGSEAEIVERSARQQRVARAVMDLVEPYRSTILYRYLDEMPMAEVARRTNVNEVTARKRLSRGLEMLRTKLDAEFGTSTRNWAIALIAPGKAALIMSTKWIAAGAAAVVLGLGWWTLHQTAAPSTTISKGPMAATQPIESPKLEPVDAPAASSSSKELASVAAPAREAGVEHDHATTLHVRIVDAAGTARAIGRIECWWSSAPSGSEPPIRTRVIADVVSEVTEIRLPGAADEALLRGWLADQRRTQEVTVRDLAHGGSAPIERDVVLTIEPPPDPSILRGIVTVDSRRFVPRGLTIERRQTNRTTDTARIEVASARFELDDAIAGAELWATSEETVPVKVIVSPEAISAGSLDLELSNARTLRLTFLHKETGKPLANLGFVVTKGIHLDGPVSRGDARVYHTDAQGQCDVRGLAAGMLVTVHPDLSRHDDPASSARVQVDARVAPWWMERVTSEPAILEVELRVVPVFPGASVFGVVSPTLLGKQSEGSERVRVMAREVAEAQPAQAYAVSMDAQGSWSFQAHWPSRFAVWLERAKSAEVISKSVEVALDSAGPHGPVELPAFVPAEMGTVFELRIDNVPAQAKVDVGVYEDKKPARHETMDCKKPPCTHTIRLAGSARINVTAFLNQNNFGSEVRRSITVDPARERSATIDLGGNQMHAVEFSLSGAAVPSYALLGFVRLGAQGLDLSEGTSTTLLDGRATAEVSLSPGRWFFECFDQQRDFNVTGMIDVPSGSEVLRIARDAVVVDSKTIPHGIDFTELDGVALGNLKRPIRYTELGPSGRVILNATARYTALP